ncbi:MAG: translation elongation factor Ts [Gemmatimonadetes bacterium]|nr:translation elongation factor Ts [Gemmatimonadota bacterium]
MAGTISAKDVAELRKQTGAGMMECKRALQESDGDTEKAIAVLRKTGAAKAEKRAERSASEGVIGSYIHFNGRVGVLIELNCETDFVARTDAFKKLARELAMQVVAGSPLSVSEEDLPSGAEGDPAELCLLRQSYIRDESKTIDDVVKEVIAQTGENIRVRRFARFELGQ